MKTIYKEPKRLGKANQMENIHKLNTTGSLRRIEGTSYDLIKSYDTPIAYVVDVENGTFLNETKVILCNDFYSMTTRKHQAIIRDLYSGCSIGEFEYKAFKKRATLDNVNILGGVNN
tara:strand:- start:198 stop:548 length:351 start_codon:yes stop_codon:yes gene_type:complete